MHRRSLLLVEQIHIAGALCCLLVIHDQAATLRILLRANARQRRLFPGPSPIEGFLYVLPPIICAPLDPGRCTIKIIYYEGANQGKIVTHNLEQRPDRKLTGTYYTPEDVVDYIVRNTVIPVLCDKAQKESPDVFDSILRVLRDNPDRYLLDSFQYGVKRKLPADIAPSTDVVLNRITPTEDGLYSENLRKHIDQRSLYNKVVMKIRNGDIRQVNDLITLPLDIGKMVQDAILRSETPDLPLAFWEALTGTSVLDPACGHGNFLVSVVDSLEPIYAVCLRNMRERLPALRNPAIRGRFPSNSNQRVRGILAGVDEHASERSFVVHAILTRNIYGVDLVKEATEECKDRLVRKMKPNACGDIGNRLNIRVGNAVTGSSFPGKAGEKDLFEENTEDDACSSCFHWFAEFPQVFAKGGFDVIVGNPPYVATSKADTGHRE